MSECSQKLDHRIFPRDCYTDSDSDGESTEDITYNTAAYICSPSTGDCTDPLDPLGIMNCTSLTTLPIIPKKCTRISPLTLPSSAVLFTSDDAIPSKRLQYDSYSHECPRTGTRPCIFKDVESMEMSDKHIPSVAPCQESMALTLHERLLEYDGNTRDDDVSQHTPAQEKHNVHEIGCECAECIDHRCDNIKEEEHQKEFVKAKTTTVRSAIGWFVGK